LKLLWASAKNFPSFALPKLASTVESQVIISRYKCEHLIFRSPYCLDTEKQVDVDRSRKRMDVRHPAIVDPNPFTRLRAGNGTSKINYCPARLDSSERSVG
jgi:hypothetical protein